MVSESSGIGIAKFMGILFILNIIEANSVSVQELKRFSNFHIEPVCNTQQEYFIDSDGKESSLILDFDGSAMSETEKLCSRILTAPENFGFVVRLILPKIKYLPLAMKRANKTTQWQNTTFDRSNEMDQLPHQNVTFKRRSCPLSIFSSLEPHTPAWILDPCHLEDTPEMEDPVRLLQGRVRIMWEHSLQKLSSKLMVTALGKGEQCSDAKKHHCLKIGNEPILCISNSLVCDGIRHCPPYTNENDSDEDYLTCWNRHHSSSSSKDIEIFEHFALEVLRSLFATNVTKMKEKRINQHQRPINKDQADLKGYVVVNDGMDSKNASITIQNKHNNSRMGLNSDLSKYGPWGYLMLGILLCGGALLICGLLASATQNATNHPPDISLQSAVYVHGSDNRNNSNPPNYDEIDPPPAYAALFPIPKDTENAATGSSDIPVVSSTIVQTMS